MNSSLFDAASASVFVVSTFSFGANKKKVLIIVKSFLHFSSVVLSSATTLNVSIVRLKY